MIMHCHMCKVQNNMQGYMYAMHNMRFSVTNLIYSDVNFFIAVYTTPYFYKLLLKKFAIIVSKFGVTQ